MIYISLKRKKFDLKNWKLKLRAHFFIYIKVCVRAHRMYCYLVHDEIAYIYACMQSAYMTAVFMNAQKLHSTLNIFFSSLFTVFFFSKRKHNSFREKKIKQVTETLENASKTLFKWFSGNQMKANSDKCHFSCSPVSLTVENREL